MQYNRVVDAVELQNREVKKAHARMETAHGEAIIARQELEENVSELTRFNDLAVGRELRMTDLKREINELRIQLGQSARYEIDEDEDMQNGYIEPGDLQATLAVSAAESPG